MASEEVPLLTGEQPPRRGCYANGMLQVCVAFCALAMTGFAVCLATRRNSRCDPAHLKGIEPPFLGELLPYQFALVERSSWFQWSKIVDVYSTDADHLGYFYDMHFLLFMRFGYSDASDRIWFEAKYSSFFSRMQSLFGGVDFYLQRCDAGGDDVQAATVFEIREDFWRGITSCPVPLFRSCSPMRFFAVSMHQPSGTGADVLEADTLFNATFTKTTLGYRWMWMLDMHQYPSGRLLAHAQQQFNLWSGKLGLQTTSSWAVNITKEKRQDIPNWVIGFMAALDDIKEEKH